MALSIFEGHQPDVQVSGPSAFRDIAGDIAEKALFFTLRTDLGRSFSLNYIVTFGTDPPVIHVFSLQNKNLPLPVIRKN